jgi:hypothetical protein
MEWISSFYDCPTFHWSGVMVSNDCVGRANADHGIWRQKLCQSKMDSATITPLKLCHLGQQSSLAHKMLQSNIKRKGTTMFLLL